MLYTQCIAIQIGVCRRGSCYPESLSCPNLRTTVTISLQKVQVYTGGAVAGVMYSVIAQQQRLVLLISARGEMWCHFGRQLHLVDGNTCVILLSARQ